MFACLKGMVPGVHWIGLGEYRGSSKRTIRGDTSEPCTSCQGAPSQSGPGSFAAHSLDVSQRRSLYISGWFGPRVSGAHSSPQMDFSLESVLPKICSRLWTVGRAAGWIHLEVLTIKDVWLPCRGRLSAMEFPRMKRLHLRKLSVSLQESLVMTLVSRCPGLLRFEWDLEKQEAPDSNRFFQLLAAKTWPRLHSLILPQHTVTEDTMATIVGAMQKVISLRFQRSESIQSGTVDLLQPHFGHLQTISLKSSRIHAAVVCPMAQGILSSCPALESFDSTRINGISGLDVYPCGVGSIGMRSHLVW